jgi:hypothetical protein
VLHSAKLPERPADMVGGVVVVNGSGLAERLAFRRTQARCPTPVASCCAASRRWRAACAHDNNGHRREPGSPRIQRSTTRPAVPSQHALRRQATGFSGCFVDPRHDAAHLMEGAGGFSLARARGVRPGVPSGVDDPHRSTEDRAARSPAMSPVSRGRGQDWVRRGVALPPRTRVSAQQHRKFRALAADRSAFAWRAYMT